jgi:hypothetical protein
MKKLFLAMICVLVAQTMWASDYIYMLDGSEVEAKVTEVTPTTIKYKKMSNVNGPVYTVAKGAVFMIKYENGQKEVFLQQETATTAPAQAEPTAQNVLDETKNLVNAYGTSTMPGLVVYDNDKPVSVNGMALNEQDYLALAQKNCMPAYQQYMSGVRLRKTGKILLCAGGGALALGTALFVTGVCVTTYGSNDYNKDAVGVSLITAGSVIGVAGSVSMLGSIPLYVIGKNKKRNSFNTYNKAIATQQAQTASLQLNVHTNGLGLALNF